MRFNLVSKLMLLMLIFLFLAQSVLAFGGRVLYQDGTPAAGAEVIVTGKDEKRTVIICDEQGRFMLENLPGQDALIHIKAANKGFAPLRLPASLFESGDVAIVLQSGVEKKSSAK